MVDKELIKNIEETIMDGFKKTDHIKNIHLEIPKWLYEEYKKSNKKHNYFYLLGWISFLEQKEHKNNNEIQTQIELLDKRLRSVEQIRCELFDFELKPLQEVILKLEKK